MVELPNLSVLVTEPVKQNWDEERKGQKVQRVISEPRLLQAVHHDIGRSVAELRTPPVLGEASTRNPTRNPANWVGVDVWPFPRWLRCNKCGILAPIDKGLFRWLIDPYRPHDAGFIHDNCGGMKIRASPVRVITACRNGHLDDFPWVEYAHRKTGHSCPKGTPNLRLEDAGYAERATDLKVSCVACNSAKESVDVAFGVTGKGVMPRCRGFHPHLRQLDPCGCDQQATAVLVGASNLWFPMQRSVLSIPGARDEVRKLVDQNWAVLKEVPDLEVLKKMADPNGPSYLKQPFLIDTAIPLNEIWLVKEEIRIELEGNKPQSSEPPDLLLPEWEMFAQRTSVSTPEFRMRDAGKPTTPWADRFSDGRQLSRLREVVALTGFTRLEAIDPDEPGPKARRAPLTHLSKSSGKCRDHPEWVPVAESRGEGVLIVLDEDKVATWEAHANGHPRMEAIRDGFRGWRTQRGLDPDTGAPNARFVLLHSLSHMLINQLALTAGYNPASIKERLYARPPSHHAGAMAGIMLYTAEPDSEGTLGGLVAQGRADRLGRTIDAALERAGLCSTDPFCAERRGDAEQGVMHGAACHACLFVPETSCEAANRFLDRSFVTTTLDADPTLPFFQ